MDKLNDLIFYNIEKAIKTYRMFAMKRIRENDYKITIDQWLIIKSILENPDITQQDIAKNVFKDNASVTRIIELMVKSSYVSREENLSDRRKFHLKVTEEGESVFENVHDLVIENRKIALKGITEEELNITTSTLKKIIANCN
ncbi:MAG: MarR family transcriptional regulator [Bacteroidota bacterium]